METPLEYKEELQRRYPESVIEGMLTRYRLSFADFAADERFYYMFKSKCEGDVYIRQLRAAVGKLADMLGSPIAFRIAKLAINNRTPQPAYPSGKRNIDGNPNPNSRR